MNEMRDKLIKTICDNCEKYGNFLCYSKADCSYSKSIADALIEAGLMFNSETDMRTKECRVKTDYYPYSIYKERYSCSLCLHRLGKRDKYCGGCGAKIKTKAEADKNGE